MIVALVPTEEVDRFWDQVEPMLAKATAYSSGRHEASDLYWSLAAGKMQLWLMADSGSIVAGAVTAINDYPNRPMLAVVFCGGTRMNEWLDEFIEKLKRFASHCQVDCIEFCGRPGWEKVLTKFGFEVKPRINMELDLK